MDNDHGITGELREWIEDRVFLGNGRQELLRIADRIDAAHEAMLVDARKTVYQGYIELPKDADGEYIHIGDMVADINEGKPFTLEEATLNKLGWTLSGSAYGEMYEPTQCRHYHKPTVEDVLREFGKAWVEWEDGSPYDPIAKFAAKLQLKEEA